MHSQSELLSTSELAQLMHCSRITAWRVARENPGFSVKFGGRYSIPREHVQRVLNGETPKEIAASIYHRHPNTKALVGA